MFSFYIISKELSFKDLTDIRYLSCVRLEFYYSRFSKLGDEIRPPADYTYIFYVTFFFLSRTVKLLTFWIFLGLTGGFTSRYLTHKPRNPGI